MTTIPALSKNLQDIVAFEIARGNIIERVDQPAGTRCPLAVIFKQPLDIKGFVSSHSLLNGVDTWENKDSTTLLKRGMFVRKHSTQLRGH